ncbi:MAG: hypothetical protein ABFD90_11040 [Phycisphaerales bacterium]
MVLGVDFDNTIVDYGSLMHAIASEQGLIGRDHPKTKGAIRDSIRRLPEGELRWRRVQAVAYGARMQEAQLVPGVEGLFLKCRRHEVPVYIVSHKTEYSNLGESDVNLRTAALTWLASRGFFDACGIALEPSRVFFHDTRDEKIERIKTLGITHFIDDLEELFRDPGFPAGVVRILFTPLCRSSRRDGIHAFASWDEITRYMFGCMAAFKAVANHG